MVELLPANTLAVDLFRYAQAVGWDLVRHLIDIELSPVDAEILLEKFAVIAETLKLQNLQKGEKPDGNPQNHHRWNN